MEYLSCPFCSWTRPKNYGFSYKRSEERKVKFDLIDPSKVKVWQLRSLGSQGRGKGYINILESKTLDQLDNDQKEQIRNQCEKILTELEE